MLFAESIQMSTSLNQETNYLLHRQLTKAEKKKMWRVLGFISPKQ